MNELIFYTGKEAKSNIAVTMCDFDDEVRVKKKPFESALLCFGFPQGVGLFLSAFAYHVTPEYARGIVMSAKNAKRRVLQALFDSQT